MFDKASNKFFKVGFFFLLLVGCTDTLEALSEEDLFNQANKLYEKKSYEDSIPLFNKFEIKYSTSPKIKEAIFKRATAAYLSQRYAEAITAFESFIERYPLDEKKVEAKKMIFFSYYNQITDYEHDMSMLEKAIMEAFELQSYNVEDKEVEEAILKIKKFIIFSEIYTLHNAIDIENWVSALWIASATIKNHYYHELIEEAYYRIIEIFACQKNKNLKHDAGVILHKMSELFPNSIWYKKAQEICQKNGVHEEMVEQRADCVEDSLSDESESQDCCA